MRIFFKIILFPFTLILSIFVVVFTFLVERVAGLLNIISGFILLGAIVCFTQYFFGWPYGESGTTFALTAGICGIVFAFLLSPYGTAHRYDLDIGEAGHSKRCNKNNLARIKNTYENAWRETNPTMRFTFRKGGPEFGNILAKTASCKQGKNRSTNNY